LRRFSVVVYTKLAVFFFFVPVLRAREAPWHWQVKTMPVPLSPSQRDSGDAGAMK